MMIYPGTIQQNNHLNNKIQVDGPKENTNFNGAWRIIPMDVSG